MYGVRGGGGEGSGLAVGEEVGVGGGCGAMGWGECEQTGGGDGCSDGAGDSDIYSLEFAWEDILALVSRK